MVLLWFLGLGNLTHGYQWYCYVPRLPGLEYVSVNLTVLVYLWRFPLTWVIISILTGINGIAMCLTVSLTWALFVKLVGVNGIAKSLSVTGTWKLLYKLMGINDIVYSITCKRESTYKCWYCDIWYGFWDLYLMCLTCTKWTGWCSSSPPCPPCTSGGTLTTFPEWFKKKF